MPRDLTFQDKYGKYLTLAGGVGVLLLIWFSAKHILHYWQASVDIFRAEKVQIETDKTGHYQNTESNHRKFIEICRLSTEAYEKSPVVFNLQGIMRARQACVMTGRNQAEQNFRVFEKQYRESHPHER